MTRRSVRLAAIVLALSAALAGAVAGAVLGELGALLNGSATTIAKLAGAGVAAAAVLDVIVGRVPLIERDRETPRRWLAVGPGRWAVYTGAMLGFGGLTRLGFVAWYLLPVTAFGTRSAVAGAAVWSVYGLARAGAPQLLQTLRRHSSRPTVLRQRVLITQGRTRARYATDCLGVALVVVMWLVVAAQS